MTLRALLPIALGSVLFAGAAFGQAFGGQGDDSPFQVAFANGFQQGTLIVRVTNNGANSTVAGPPNQNGNICVNLYQFDTAGNMQSCCTCNVKPNNLASLPISGTFTPVVLKALASAGSGGTCNASTVNAGTNVLVTGMVPWVDFVSFQSPTQSKLAFTPSTLVASELATLQAKCLTQPGAGATTCTGCPAS